MERTQSTGWRAMGAAMPAKADLRSATKDDLFEAKRLAALVFRPPAAARYLLDQLIGFFGGELIENRIIVWPSNELLMERTGLAERTVRHAAKYLIDLGLITTKDSPNGKRFAQKSPRGQIVTAYGFDLSPLLARLQELRQRAAAIKGAARARSRTFDEITIDRRAAQEAIRALQDWFPEVGAADLLAELERLAGLTPRRSSLRPVDELRKEWAKLRATAEQRYYTASGGKNGRHKDTNNETPDQSCNNGREDDAPAAPLEPGLTLSDIIEACPDALSFTGPLRSDRELVTAASTYRGGFGVNIDAWEKACMDIGPLQAAVVFMMVLQLQARPGKTEIANPGGYYRAMTRLVAEGRVNLHAEIQRLKKKGRH